MSTNKSIKLKYCLRVIAPMLERSIEMKRGESFTFFWTDKALEKERKKEKEEISSSQASVLFHDRSER